MKLKLTLLFCLTVFAHSFSTAQHGGLDITFGTGGITTSAIGVNGDFCSDIAVQDDGKILLVGRTDNGTNNDLVLARYNADGTLDTSFDGDGDTSINLGGDERGTAVVATPDGKILVAGYRNEAPNRDFLLYKFNNDGTVDMTFGTNGRVDTDFGNTDDLANNIMLTSSKIVVTGQVKNGSDNDFAAARYNADGTTDNSFGTLGKATFDVVENDQCFSSVLQQDGKLILFGQITLAGNVDFAMIRCNENGTLDNDFGSSGITVTDFSGGTDRGYSVVLQQDAKIVAVGLADQATSNANLGVVRYNEDGSLDSSFGVGGMISDVVGTGEYESRNFAAVQSDGKILIAGTSTNTGFGDDITLIRLNSNGSFDNTFGTNGIVTTDILTESNSSQGIAVQPDAKILVCGRAFPDGTNNGDFALYRYLSGLELGILDFSMTNNSLLVYPNPIQESAAIEYSLTNDETISIDLYNMSGSLVQSLVRSEKRRKGEHRERLYLDASIPSGSYILTLGNGAGSSSVQVVK